MGELIVNGIKMAMIAAAAIALTAAITILFNLVSTAIAGLSVVAPVAEVLGVIAVYMPFSLQTVFLAVTALMSYKVSYFLADKMIEIINAV